MKKPDLFEGQKDVQGAKLLKQHEMHFTGFQPKQNHRFLVNFPDLPDFLIKSISRPKGKYDYDLFNFEWELMIIKLYDAIVPSAAQVITEWLSTPQTKDFVIKVLGPVGDVVERWNIKEAKIVEFDFGTLAWNDDAPTEIELKISFESVEYSSCMVTAKKDKIIMKHKTFPKQLKNSKPGAPYGGGN